jgi:sialate O-acetylesterase
MCETAPDRASFRGLASILPFMKSLHRSFAFVTIVVTASFARADVVPNPLFADNAVLQQGLDVPVWGTADAGERVTVEFAGQRVTTSAAQNGTWLVKLAPLTAGGGPATMTIAGKNTVTLQNILVGEVWICSGQSNMERQLGPRPPQQPIANWEKEVAAAKYPEIRHFAVAQKTSFTPETKVAGAWAVCSPETVADFSAVAYFFGRDLYKARHVPVGLIHSSWGGTPAEAWTSPAALSAMPDFADDVARVERTAAEVRAGTFDFSSEVAGWYQANDAGTMASPAWSSRELNTEDWTTTLKLPIVWEDDGLPEFDGVVWFRKTFDLPAGGIAHDMELHLGSIDDIDTTWVNGVEVGSTSGWNTPRVYPVPASLIKPTGNVIAVRVLDTGGGGGIWRGPSDKIFGLVFNVSSMVRMIDIGGAWQRKVGATLAGAPRPPVDFSKSASAPSVLYNGMIAPLLPYAMRGVIWYQGEADVGREKQYRTLFPAMIADWRRAWGEGDFPFLFVQIAPFKDSSPEIREAQLLALQRAPRTAMAVTLDCGDVDDIHPPHKQPVGARLALAARALAYGESIEYSGPLFEAARFDGTRAIVRFTHLGGGLVAKDGALEGFTLAGADKKFVPARASIEGDTIVVTAGGVAHPAAVRYAWAKAPEGNLFNAAGLPASPFRSDVD